MKILYLTVPSFFDLEISLIRELKKMVDIKVVMIVSPESMRSSAFSIDKLDKRCAIIPAAEYQGMEKYNGIIDLKDWYIANNPSNSFFHCFSLARKIFNFFKQNRFTVLHSTTDCKTATAFIPYVWMIHNTMYTVHDPIPHKKLSFLSDFFKYKLVFKSYKNLLLLSDALLDSFCNRYKIKKERVFFSRLSIYSFLQYYKVSPNFLGQYMLFFGKILPYKGVDNLIDAYMQCEVRKHGVKLVIAGKGEINHNKSNLSEDVVFINRYVDNEELANLIRHCRFVVLPYISATQSGCVMSAFAFNKPVVATNVGDLPKEVEDGRTGVICQANDINDLQNAIDKMGRIDLTEMESNIRLKYADGGSFSWCAAAQSIADSYVKIGE